MNEFRTIILQTAPRLLGFMDRDKDSRTHGCGDRYYWHYRLHDVSNARFQEISLFLALLYTNDFEQNVYFKKPVVRDWVLAGVRFWSTLIRRAGYLSEVYPFERSYCATAFSTFAALESLLVLSQSDPEAGGLANNLARDPEFQKKLGQVGRWLTRNCNDELTNQMAASALALQNISRCANAPEFQTAAEQLIAKIIRRYGNLGFHTEYGGFDLGYTSITNSLLSRYNQKVPGNKELLAVLQQSNDRIDRETDEQGLYDPADKSRKTQFLYPFGLLAAQSPAFDKVLRGIANNSIITPLWMDDRYCIGLATDYLQTYLAVQNSRGAAA